VPSVQTILLDFNRTVSACDSLPVHQRRHTARLGLLLLPYIPYIILLGLLQTPRYCALRVVLTALIAIPFVISWPATIWGSHSNGPRCPSVCLSQANISETKRDRHMVTRKLEQKTGPVVLVNVTNGSVGSVTSRHHTGRPTTVMSHNGRYLANIQFYQSKTVNTLQLTHSYCRSCISSICLSLFERSQLKDTRWDRQPHTQSRWQCTVRFFLGAKSHANISLLQ